jgi:hypothetical protein
MPRKYAVDYIDRLLTNATYGDLVDLSSAICSSAQFRATSADYGLPQFAFLFAETLLWFAQATRSGVWTYYEATSRARQDAMAAALREAAPEEFASWYERGMHDWRDETRITAVDFWIEANDQVANEWLRTLARRNREALLELTAE